MGSRSGVPRGSQDLRGRSTVTVIGGQTGSQLSGETISDQSLPYPSRQAFIMLGGQREVRMEKSVRWAGFRKKGFHLYSYAA